MDVGKEIVKSMKEFTKEVNEAINDEIEITAKAVVKDAKKTAPKRTGKYRKSIKVDKNKIKKNRRNYQNTVYASGKLYRLAHLLEKGHAKRSGGRVKAKPHFEPAWEKEKSKFEKRVEEIIENGS